MGDILSTIIYIALLLLIIAIFAGVALSAAKRRRAAPGAILDLDREYDKLAALARRSVDMRMVYDMVGID